MTIICPNDSAHVEYLLMSSWHLQQPQAKRSKIGRFSNCRKFHFSPLISKRLKSGAIHPILCPIARCSPGDRAVEQPSSSMQCTSNEQRTPCQKQWQMIPSFSSRALDDTANRSFPVATPANRRDG